MRLMRPLTSNITLWVQVPKYRVYSQNHDYDSVETIYTSYLGALEPEGQCHLCNSPSSSSTKHGCMRVKERSEGSNVVPFWVGYNNPCKQNTGHNQKGTTLEPLGSNMTP